MVMIQKMVVVLCFFASSMYGMHNDLAQRTKHQESPFSKKTIESASMFSDNFLTTCRTIVPYARRFSYAILPSLAACADFPAPSNYSGPIPQSNMTITDDNGAQYLLIGGFALLGCCVIGLSHCCANKRGRIPESPALFPPNFPPNGLITMHSHSDVSNMNTHGTPTYVQQLAGNPKQ
jgi:hypothetical protein